MLESFQRIEKKYLISKEQYDKVIEKLKGKVRKDYYCRNGAYTIYNIYFDNHTNQIIQRSNLKPFYKEKLRIRAYDLARQEDNCYLEIKRKIGRIVSKRRIQASLLDINHFITTGIIPYSLSTKEKQIAKEINYLIKNYMSYPKVFLSYKREAYYDKEDDQLRITFDYDLLYRFDKIEFYYGNYGKSILENDNYIMEIKFIHALPKWLVEILSELNIFPTSYSKYGEIYKSYLKENIYNVY